LTRKHRTDLNVRNPKHLLTYFQIASINAIFTPKNFTLELPFNHFVGHTNSVIVLNKFPRSRGGWKSQ